MKRNAFKPPPPKIKSPQREERNRVRAKERRKRLSKEKSNFYKMYL